jgi:hypothetical protein
LQRYSVVATTSSERHAHEREGLKGEIERFRHEAYETRVEAAKREDVLRQEVHQATQRAQRMESMVGGCAQVESSFITHSLSKAPGINP